MKLRIVLSSMIALLCLAATAVPATAGTIYGNGPVSGDFNAYAFNGQNFVSDTFAVSGGSSTISGISIWVWAFPANHNPMAEVTITSQANGGTVYFDQRVQFTEESNCYAEGVGFNICQETASWTNGPTLPNGTYWVNLKNGAFSSGDPVYWDQNSGVGCNSPGCPSQAQDSFPGTIPSESFTIFGSGEAHNGTTPTNPKTSSIFLFGSGFAGLMGMMRRTIG